MTARNFKTGLLVGVLGMAGVIPVSAQLPMLTDKELLGYFLVADSKNFQFRIGADGKTSIKVIDSKGNPVNNDLTIPSSSPSRRPCRTVRPSRASFLRSPWKPLMRRR
jgi:hypothetical protein